MNSTKKGRPTGTAFVLFGSAPLYRLIAKSTPQANR